MGANGLELEIEVESRFELEKAVCNHGFFMMAPNSWIPETKTLQRPLRLLQYKSVLISISQPSNSRPLLLVHVLHNQDVPLLTSADRQAILHQVRRMLRIYEKDQRDLTEFQKMHPQAKEKGYGRLFRSPSLFEDVVKSILLCNCTWKRTLSMAQALCDLQPKLAAMLEHGISNSRTQGKKRKKEASINKHFPQGNASSSSISTFPCSRELGTVDEDFLRKECNLGHRAKTILNLVRRIENGMLNLDEFEQSSSYEEVSRQIMKIKGIGPFTNANVLMCLGFYHQIPVDSETIRLIQKVHGKENCTNKNIRKYVEEIYDIYEPFQCWEAK